MRVVQTVDEVRECVSAWRADNKTTALVPTMGGLHRGHLALFSAASEHADTVVVCVFVNPLQFDCGDDFRTYPRTPDADLERLRESGVALVFIPETTEIYPPQQGADRGAHKCVDPGVLGKILCGAHRPGHFAGVATVVVRLFDIFTPDIAVFGEKDYQQLVLIRQLVKDFDLNVRVVAVPTVRDADGLALSSRNLLLSEEQRARAAALYRVLRETAGAVRNNGDARPFSELVAVAWRYLEQAGLQPDYVEIRNARTLAPADTGTQEEAYVVLAAVRLGKVRLIDNVIV